jgi:hypothetical protein
MNDRSPAAPAAFAELDAYLSQEMSWGYWDACGCDDAAAILQRLDDGGWRALGEALGEPARDGDWRDRCFQALAFGPVERVAPLAIAALLSHEPSRIVAACDLLRDWRPELILPLPREAIAAAWRSARSTRSDGDRLAIEAFLTWAGER